MYNMSMLRKRQLPVVNMRLFKPGSQVMYQGRMHYVDHVLLNRRGLFVFLDGITGPIDSDHVECAPTAIDFNRGRIQ
jgi:hypothetical protein